MEGEKQQLHLALLPWLAFGHFNPFLHLAVSLADVGLRISYLTTSRNIQRLPVDSIPPHLSSNIKFISLTMPSVDGLPENAEATVDLTADDQNPILQMAYDQLKDQVKTFLASDDAPDHLIYDLFAPWAPEAALEAGGVPSTVFFIIPSFAMAFQGWPHEGVNVDSDEGLKQWWPSPETLMSLPDWVPIPTKMHYRRWEAERFYPEIFGKGPSGVSVLSRYVRSIERSSGAIFIRCCNEFNAEFLELLPKLLGKPVIPVGWLPPTVRPIAQYAGSGNEEKRVETLDWLDGRPTKSVVFVSFGSEYKFNRAAILELAHGLELSNLSFLWVLRRPAWLSNDEEDNMALPVGFRSRTQGRGLVSFGWAPQLMILAHKSVGVVLYHGGWSTTIESLSFGLVSVLLAGFVDQSLISQQLVEKGLGVEIERDEADGSFCRHGVAKALRIAMASDETERLRKKAAEISAVLADQSVHDNYIIEFIDFLTKKSGSKKPIYM